MKIHKTILVAPLNWGLGHATRSIPIIYALLADGFEVIIASDGMALTLLQKEFPQLEGIELPSYKIEYAKKGKRFKWKMLLRSPKVLKAIRQEREQLKELVKNKKIDGVISDNRLGLYHTEI
ncbi:MAG TPA: glycosyltransferase, partial [Leeuwenhoekiella sp.]|nr:glycosyltransferase [Leeuwenhoekiella sp.]